MAPKTPIRGFSARITARTVLASTLRKPVHADACRREGLLDADLAEIETRGKQAEEYDRQQHGALATQQGDITKAAEAWTSLASEEDELRNRLSAVADALAADPATEAQAAWLGNVSFDRFRVRIVPAKATPAPAAVPATPAPATPATRERTTRVDRLSRAQEIVHFTRALLEADHAPIIARFEARGMARDRIVAIATAAEAQVAKLGAPKLATPSATSLESEAVSAQKHRWEVCRRMIRAVVTGNAELEKLWAAC